MLRLRRTFTAALVALTLALPLSAQAGAPARASRAAAKPAASKPIAARRAVVFVGMPGAGKSFVSKKLAEKLGTPQPLVSGDVIREAIGPTKTKEEQGRRALEVSKEFAKKKGEVGRRVALKARAQEGGTVVVEGFRTPADLAAFKREFPNTVVVAVDVPTTLRHSRLLSRGRPGEDNRGYLRKRDAQERSVGLGELIKGADMKVTIKSNDPAEVQRALDRLAVDLGR